MKIRSADRLLRIVGWLLTPLVVWAASFLGGWIGAAIGQRVGSAESGLVWLLGGAVLSGAGVFILWAVVVQKRALRRMVRLRKRILGEPSDAGSETWDGEEQRR